LYTFKKIGLLTGYKRLSCLNFCSPRASALKQAILKQESPPLKRCTNFFTKENKNNMNETIINGIEPDDFLTARNFVNLVDMQMRQAVIGQPRAIKGWKLSMMTGESFLLVGPPGTAKSHLCKVGAAVIGGTAKVTQGTPDAMASDLTGRFELKRQTGNWEFREGSLFANCVLLDELNRLPPKVQSALLEAMQFGEVTVEGETRKLPEPWIVMGAMNPEGNDAGTYPIPRPAKDRWGLGAVIERPTEDEEVRIARGNYLKPGDVKALDNGLGYILGLQRLVNNLVPSVPDHVSQYAVEIVRKTMDRERFSVEASPRASIVMVRAAVADAVMRGESEVTVQNVQAVARFALEHKVRLADELEMDPKVTIGTVLQELIGYTDEESHAD
jgi:MoxR-like ATPase